MSRGARPGTALGTEARTGLTRYSVLGTQYFLGCVFVLALVGCQIASYPPSAGRAGASGTSPATPRLASGSTASSTPLGPSRTATPRVGTPTPVTETTGPRAITPTVRASTPTAATDPTG